MITQTSLYLRTAGAALLAAGLFLTGGATANAASAPSSPAPVVTPVHLVDDAEVFNDEQETAIIEAFAASLAGVPAGNGEKPCNV